MSAARVAYHQGGRPCLGETVSGDATLIKECDRGLLIAIVDGLGHGPAAHQVASRIVRWLKAETSTDVTALLGALHLEMRGSIGASVGLAYVDLEKFQIDYAGVGNTQAKIVGNRNKNFTSRPGNIGATMRSVFLQQETLAEGDLVLFYTDGIKEHLQLPEYPALMTDPPAVVSANIISRFGKHYDDAACIVMKCNDG